MYYIWCMDLKRVHNVFSFHAMIYTGILCWVSQSYLLLSDVSDKDLHVFYISCWSLRHYGRDGVSNHQPHRCLLKLFIQAQIQENINAPRYWPLCGEFTGDRCIFRTKGQLRGKCFHLMTSSWIMIPFNCELSDGYGEHPVIWPGLQRHVTFHFIRTLCLAHISTYTLPYTIPTLHVDALWSLNNPAFTNWRWMGSMGSVWRMGVDLTPTMPVHLVYIFTNWQGLSRWRKL